LLKVLEAIEKEPTMTRSIFDPQGRETERSGSTFKGPDAGNISRVPADVTDGEVSEQEARDAESVERADAEKLAPEERLASIPRDPIDQE
jgi:hypothetical protein